MVYFVTKLHVKCNPVFFFAALHFYRQAVQLVPDIESRMIDFTNNLMQGKS